jgi:hypothetical protein
VAIPVFIKAASRQTVKPQRKAGTRIQFAIALKRLVVRQSPKSNSEKFTRKQWI